MLQRESDRKSERRIFLIFCMVVLVSMDGSKLSLSENQHVIQEMTLKLQP